MNTRTISKGSITFRVVSGGDRAYDRFWDWYESPDWERDTVHVFDMLLRPETRYVDLGAWIGPTVLLAAARVSQVVCAEPDPIARAELERNLALNPELRRKVRVREEAVTATDGVRTLSAEGERGQSTSSVVERPGAQNAWTVRAIGINTFLAAEDTAGSDFFKLDVEGAEYEIIPAMRRYIRAARPTIYVATHPNVVFDKSTLLTRLRSGARVLYLNWRLLRTLFTYRYHLVYDEATAGFKNIRGTNLRRLLVPLPFRSALLIGSCLFTDQPPRPRS